MSNRLPVTQIVDLDGLDEPEIQEGYFDGFKNEPCGDNRSRSYWHGWRNGMVDGGHAKGDASQAKLAHDYMIHQTNPPAPPAQGRDASGRE